MPTKPSETPTPRTDAHIEGYEVIGSGGFSSFKELVKPEFARSLERENARLRAALENVMQYFDDDDNSPSIHAARAALAAKE